MTRRWLLLFPLFLPLMAQAATTRNDASCDIALLPAATLLVPYFEVDLEDRSGETTLFTVTNVTNVDQIARVTLWTDYAYPVLSFNVYLTGYDVQAINLFDVIGRGQIAPDQGTGTAVARRGTFSDSNAGLDLRFCDRLPGALDNETVRRLQDAFTEGRVPASDFYGLPAACEDIGGVHARATGYATIDVVRGCAVTIPTDAAYWSEDIGYDNVLTGDYQQINTRENFAQGGALVHIRAIPEGETAETRAAQPAIYDVGFERTFYSRYQAPDTPRLDGRQPLPSTFATRWISGSSSGFQTSLKIWRESRTDAATSCDQYSLESGLRATEMVVFDDNENAMSMADAVPSPGLIRRPQLPATSRTEITDSDVYPQMVNGEISGWLYLNLDHTRGDDIASQNWVIGSMRASGRYSTDIDALALGNGCSAEVTSSAARTPIQPAANDTGTSTVRATTSNDDSCDIALLPAATLLLPYFEVDLEDGSGETTLVTITNVSPRDQIARVTLWTDLAFPVITFNIYLTGYDVQSLNLFDVLSRGVIAPAEGTGTSVRARGAHSAPNTALDLRDCGILPGALPDDFRTRIQQAFTLGTISASDPEAACNKVGNEHDVAVGYATIDLVANCSLNTPADAQYWSEDLRYDNVLIGDVQQVHSSNNAAQGTTLVHIRAIPEGGTPATRGRSPFARTFYARQQNALTPQRDGRQPLPTTFASRWIQGTASAFETSMKIWREAKISPATCDTTGENGRMEYVEIARFDEAENVVSGIQPCVRCSPPIFFDSFLPATSRVSVSDASIFPQLTNGAGAGWMYLNLDDSAGDARATSNWVVTSMRAQGSYSVDMDAPALGNGCSPPTGGSEILEGSPVVIGPAVNQP